MGTGALCASCVCRIWLPFPPESDSTNVVRRTFFYLGDTMRSHQYEVVVTGDQRRVRLLAQLQRDLQKQMVYLSQPLIEIVLDAYDARRIAAERDAA
jgi:hypothetical protein